MLSTTFPHSPTSPTCTPRRKCPSSGNMCVDEKEQALITLSHIVTEHGGDMNTMHRVVSSGTISCHGDRKKEKVKEVEDNREKAGNNVNTHGPITSLKNCEDIRGRSLEFPNPFDFILMDIQMPVMGETVTVYLYPYLRSLLLQSIHYYFLALSSPFQPNV